VSCGVLAPVADKDSHGSELPAVVLADVLEDLAASDP
jgi:hypothetical protein